MEFKNLHRQDEPLLICNAWDVPSAKMAEHLDFQAIGTSSAAIAALLGYSDGEEILFSELEFVVKRIVQKTNLPVSVDIESGYSRDSKQIADNIRRLADIGVVGVNIEDSVVSEQRELLDAQAFAQTIAEVKSHLDRNQVDVFINVRTDTFLVGHEDVIHETRRRIDLYAEAGADGIFTPCIEKESDIEQIVQCTNLPINVMCMPNLPDFNKLQALGVKRISMGNFLFDKMYTELEQTTKKVLKEKSFSSIF